MRLSTKILTTLLVAFCLCLFTTFVACSDEEESIYSPGFSIISTPYQSLPSDEETESSETDSSVSSESSFSEESATSSEADSESSISSAESSVEESSSEASESVEDSQSPPPTAHTHVWWEEIREYPTCEEEGYRSLTCYGCGDMKEETIPALEHIIVYTPGQLPTCKDEGWTESSYCSRCETAFLVMKILPKLTYHNVVDNACTICDYTEILYEITPSGYYVCIGSIFKNPTDLVIADTYMGKQVRAIKAGTFEKCYSLARITLGANITEIGEKAFYNCYNLFEIYNKSDINLEPGSADKGYVAYHARDVYTQPHESKIHTTDDGVITYDSGEDIIFLGYSGDEIEITLPEGITRLNSFSFAAWSLVEVTLPSTVVRLDNYAFHSNKTLEKINLNAELTDIGKLCFYNMESLLQIVFAQPNGWVSVSAMSSEITDITDEILNPYEATVYFSKHTLNTYHRNTEN